VWQDKNIGSVPITGVEPFCLFITFPDQTGLLRKPLRTENTPINEEEGEPRMAHPFFFLQLHFDDLLGATTKVADAVMNTRFEGELIDHIWDNHVR